MHSDWFSGIEILQGRWQHGEKVGYCYPSGLEKTLCKWVTCVPLVTKGLNTEFTSLLSKILSHVSRLSLYQKSRIQYISILLMILNLGF
jgi:hypothetical protein